MKNSKFAIAICTFVAMMIVSSCSTKPKVTISEAEQEELEAGIVLQLDSLAMSLSEIYDDNSFITLFNSDSIRLTDDQLKVKQDYLLTENDLIQLVELSQKYRAYAIAMTDSHVRKLYNLNGDASFSAAIGKLQMDINDAALEKMKGEGTDAVFSAETYRVFYNEMKEAGRLDYFYDATTAIAVETLFLLSNNIDIYSLRLNDAAAVAITKHMQTTIQALKLLAQYRPQLHQVLLTIKPMAGINATNAAELKQQLQVFSTQIKVIRRCLLTGEQE